MTTPHVFLLPASFPGPLPSTTVQQGWIAFMIDRPDTFFFTPEEINGGHVGIMSIGPAVALAAGTDKQQVQDAAYARLAKRGKSST